MTCANNNSNHFPSWNANRDNDDSDNQNSDTDSNENNETSDQDSSSRPEPPPRLPPLRWLMPSPLLVLHREPTANMTPEERAQQSRLILNEALAIVMEPNGEAADENGRTTRNRRDGSNKRPPTFPPRQ